MKHQITLIIHLLAATIWVGGHLILCFRYLPKALKKKDPQVIREFEKQYEPLGIPALILLIITGILMAYDYNATISTWFSFSNNIEKVVSIKLLLLFSTLILAIHARFFLIPKLNPSNLLSMSLHIVILSSISVAMLVFGSLVRIGGV
jgi:putative copper export protein